MLAQPAIVSSYGAPQATRIFNCAVHTRNRAYQGTLIEPTVGNPHWGLLMIAPSGAGGIREVFVYVFASSAGAKAWLADAKAGMFPWIGSGLQGLVVGKAALISHEPIHPQEVRVVAACQRRAG